MEKRLIFTTLSYTQAPFAGTAPVVQFFPTQLPLPLVWKKWICSHSRLCVRCVPGWDKARSPLPGSAVGRSMAERQQNVSH